MNLDNLTFIVGLILSLIVVIKKFINKKKKFEYNDLFAGVGHFFLSYLTIIIISQSLNLLYLTYTNKLTQEIILINKVYLYLTWAVLALSGIGAYISYLIEIEEKPKSEVEVKASISGSEETKKVKI